MALRFGDLAFGLGIWLSVQHALLRPSGAGGGFKRSTHSASPGIDYKHISLSTGLANQRINRTAWSGFCRLGCLGCLLGYVGKVLELLGGLLAPLGASWRPLGTLLARLGASWWPLWGHLVLFGASWRPLRSS